MLARRGGVAAPAARTARRERPAGDVAPAGLSASWGIVRWGGLIGAARRRRRLFIFMRPRRGSRAWAEGPQGDRPCGPLLLSLEFSFSRVVGHRFGGFDAAY